MGKDLMQMIEAVADASTNEFERLKEFGIKAKQQGDKVTFTFRGVATTVKKDAANIQQYLIGLGNTQFAGAMDDQMGRLSAKTSNLQTSVAQLYDEIGRAGVANSFGSAIDSMASSIDDLTKHVSELIGLLSTLTNIVMIGGSLYLGMKAMPILMGYAATTSKLLATNIFATSMAYKAGITPLALFTGGLKASTAATKAAIVQNGLLRSSAQLLFAAYAGWEFGSYLREQFVDVRVAGLAFVGAMETGLVNLSYAFSAVAPKAKQIWGELTSWLQNKLGSLYNLIGDGLAKIGADDMAQNYHAFAQSLAGSSDAAKAATQELTKLEEQRKKEIALVDQTIISLIQHEYALKNNTTSTKLNTKKKTQKTAATVKELSTNQKLIVSLGKELAMSQLTAKQKLLNTNLSKLSAEATQAERDQIIALTEELIKQQQLQEDNQFLDNMINGANDFSNAWSSAGNVIIDTFGSIGQQLDKLSKQQSTYAKEQLKLAKLKQQYADDPKQLAKIGKAEEKLAFTRTSANLSSYAAITGAASKMFSENSKARKTMHAMEQVFTVAEVALAMQRAVANAIASIANQGNGDPYSAFARIAAMAAIMAGLGIAVSGGGGNAPSSSATRQQNQGTGTVLGSDDKSQSILNAFDRIESLELDQYAELRQMNGTLRDLNNNITHLAVSLVRGYGKFDGSSYGGELGSKSTTTKFEELLIGGVFGQVAKALDPTGIIGKIFSSFSSKKKSLIDSGISIVAQTLGQVINSGVLQAKAFFDIKTKKKSFWGLSSSTKYNTEYQSIDAQLQREFALIFTNIGDSINAAVDVLGLDVTRNLANFVIDLPNISFKDMSGEQIQKELEAMFSQQADMMATYLVPSIGDFQQAGEGLYETLIRVAQEQVVFNQVLELTAQSLNSLDAYAQIEVAQSIIEFAGSIEALQSAANTYLNEFFSDAEQFDFLSTQLNSQFSELNINLPKTRDGFKNLLGSLDLTVESDQRLYAALMLLIPQLDSYYDALEQQRKKAEEAAKAERQLADDRRAFTVDLKQQLASFDMSSLELAVRDVNNWRDNAIASAKDFVGMDFSLIEKIAGKKREKIVEDTLKQIISTSENKMTQLVSNFDNNVNAITNTLEQLTSAIKSTSLSIGEAILTIQKTLPSFDGVAFFGGKASSLRGQLGSGSASSQLNVIEQLKAAIVERYNAELTAITRVQTLGDERYQTELDSYQTQLDAVNSLRDAAISLKKAASDLLVGDLSPLTMSQQLSEAQAQFNRLVAKAKGGDVNAYNDLQSSGSNYLKVAQQYDPANYQGIFDSVYGTFNNLGNKTFSDPTAPLPNPATTAYQQQSEQLAQRTISELQNLQALTQTLTVTATQEYNNAFAELQNQFTSDSSAIITTMQNSIGELRDLLPVETDKMLEKMQQQIDAIFDMRNAVVSSVDALELNIPDPAPINIEIPPMEIPPWFKKLPIEITYPPLPPIYDPETGGIFNEDPKPEPKQIEQLKKINDNLAAQGKILQKTQQANELQAKRLDKLDRSFNSLSKKLNDVNNELLDKIDKGAA